jgi:hypothetical protein
MRGVSAEKKKGDILLFSVLYLAREKKNVPFSPEGRGNSRIFI